MELDELRDALDRIPEDDDPINKAKRREIMKQIMKLLAGDENG